VTDRVGDLVRGSVSQTDMGATLAEIRKIDPDFDFHHFLDQCKLEIIPPVLEAYMQGLEDVLKDWCHEPVRLGGSGLLLFFVDVRVNYHHPLELNLSYSLYAHVLPQKY